MLRKSLLLAVFVALAYGFRVSPDFSSIAAGVAIFLLGMSALEHGFKAFSGGVLENFLKRTTNTTWKSLGFGIVATTLMQSSSLVSVLTISFLSAGLIALSQGIGIVFGANLGTTTGAWLVAGLGLNIDMGAYALPLLVFGAILFLQRSGSSLQNAGWLLVGLGFLFLGIAYMKTGFETVGHRLDLAQFAVSGFKGLLIYTGIGIVATVIMQSSHATLILTLTALAAGQLSYENALALAIGSNVGTTVTAIIGALGASVAGRRLALAHLVFNLTTGALAIALLREFAQSVDWISRLLGIAADNYTLKFAVFHSLFNLVGVALMLPLIGVLVKALEWLLREKADTDGHARVLFLNDAALALPDTALEVISKESVHMAVNAFEILAHAMNLKRSQITSSEDINAVLAHPAKPLTTDIDDLYRRKVKPLYSAIIDFSIRAESAMDESHLERLNQLKRANWQIANAIKAMNDMHSNVSRYIRSDNEYVRNEYNGIRLHVALLLRVLFSLEAEYTPAVRRERLARLKLSLEEQDIIRNGTLDKLIREQHINSTMATSLMNDTAYAYEIQSNLIAAAEAIRAGMVPGSRELELTEAEIDAQIQAKRDEIFHRLAQEKAHIDAIGGKKRQHRSA